MDSKMVGQGGAYVTQKAPMASDRRCFICNKGGHFARNCRSRFGNVASNKTEKKEFANVFTESQVDLLKIENLQLAQGKVFGIPVNVLRNTGCTTVLVKKQFVPGCAFIGLKKSLVLLDGTSRQTPIARVCIESPFFSDTIEALCVDNCICDVVLGNIPGAWPSVIEIMKTEANPEVSAGVTTRAQSKKQTKPFEPLKTKVVNFSDVNKDNMGNYQQADLSLRKYFDLAKEGEIMDLSKAQSARFDISKGILYRYHSSSTGVVTRQLMVPCPLRNKVISLGHDSIMSGHLGIARTWNGSGQIFIGRDCRVMLHDTASHVMCASVQYQKGGLVKPRYRRCQ